MSPARFSVQQKVLVNLAFLLVLLAGIMVSRGIPVDVFPDISFNSAIVVTPWPGASADEIERLVTRKIEDEIRDINGIKEWSSFSREGASEINIEWKETMSEAEQQASLNELRAAIDRVADLPPDVEESILKELSVSEVSNVCMVALSDLGGVSEYTLREWARFFERKVERVPGVRKGKLMGSRDREIRVYVDRDRALQFDLTLEEISQTIASNNVDIPGGSFSSHSEEEVTLRGLGSFVSPEELSQTVIRKNREGNHIQLHEVADVVSSFEKRQSFGYLNGRPTILIGISKNPDADVSEVVGQVRTLVESEARNLPVSIEADVIWDESIFVQRRITTLQNNLALGIALVILILWLTLGFRNSLLAIIGIPFSFLMALILFPALGLTINLLSLVGFVMVSGMLVDDAIIVIENIYRHIESGESVAEASINGAREVMWPVVAACTTTMAAFAPMLLVTGTSGQFMSILPKTVIACLAGSIVESLFVLPAHYVEWGSRLRRSSSEATRRYSLSQASQVVRARMDRFIERIRSSYTYALSQTLEHRGSFLLATLGLAVLALGLSTRVRVDLFPSDFNQLFVSIETPVDFTIRESDEVIRGIEAALEPLQSEFLSVSTYVGQGMAANERPVFGNNYGVFYIEFDQSADKPISPNVMVQKVRDLLSNYRSQNPYGIENITVMPPRNGPPIGKPVAVRIVTEEYDLAKQIAMDMKLELAKMPGVYNIEDNMPYGRKELRIGLDEYRASLHGLTFQNLAMALRTANDGLIASTFKDPYSDEDVDIRVLLKEDQRTTAAELIDVDVRTPENYRVKIGDVGTVEMSRSYQRLYHYDAQRAVVVYADVDNQRATSVSANEALKARFADISKDHPGVSVVYGGEFQATNEAFADMGRAFIVALLAIYSILAAQFRSYLQPLIVMSVIVFSFVGVILGMYLFDYGLSMYVLYGVVGLAGVVVNNSLVLIDFTNKERARGAPAKEAVLISGERRFRPVLLTTITTVAGLLPMALGIWGESLVFGPFAAAIVAGLSVSSLLTLFVVPSLYVSLDALRARLSGSERRTSPAGAQAGAGLK